MEIQAKVVTTRMVGFNSVSEQLEKLSRNLFELGQPVAMPFSPQEARTFRGKVFTHNHPSTGSFSPQDIAFASRWQLAEMRVASRIYDYTMRAPPGQNWSRRLWDTSIRPAVAREDRAVRLAQSRRVRRGDLTSTEAGRRHWHLVWRRVARRTGLRYSRRAVKP